MVVLDSDHRFTSNLDEPSARRKTERRGYLSTGIEHQPSHQPLAAVLPA